MVEFQEKCRVVSIDQLASDVYRLVVQAQLITAAAYPGQFVMVRVADRFDPLLRRPFSIHLQSSDGTLGLLFKTIGKGTDLLATVSVGDSLDLIGPLGRGFDLASGRPVCIIGGGMGIAPLYFLAKRLPGITFSIVFIDPPYRKGLSTDILQKLAASDFLAPEAFVVVEEDARTELQVQVAELRLVDQRCYGETGFWFYRQK